MEIMSIVKEHPVPIGIGVVVILLIAFSRGSSSSASSGSGAGAYLQSQAIAANSNTQLADINSKERIALGTQSVETNRIAADAATARTAQTNNLFGVLGGLNAQLQMSSDKKLLQSEQQTYSHFENLKAMASNLEMGKATIDASIKVSSNEMAYRLQAQQEDSNLQLNMLGKQIQGQLDLVHDNATSLPMILQHQESMSKIAGNNAYMMTQADRMRAAAEQDKMRAEAANSISDAVRRWFSF